MSNGDPIMDAPPQADPETARAYLKAYATGVNQCYSYMGILLLPVLTFAVCNIASVRMFGQSSDVVSGLVAAVVFSGLLFWRHDTKRRKASVDLAKTQATYAVRAALKEKEIEAARARGDFDRFNKT